MSALVRNGHSVQCPKADIRTDDQDVCFVLKAAIADRDCHVRFVPKTDKVHCNKASPHRVEIPSVIRQRAKLACRNTLSYSLLPIKRIEELVAISIAL